MPSVNFEVSWPDGDTRIYYSPSTVIHEYLKPGEQYPLDEFDTRTSTALRAASERVKSKFGYYCSAAADELEQIQTKLEDLRSRNVAGAVTVLNMN